jgi:hypothetical protein
MKSIIEPPSDDIAEYEQRLEHRVRLFIDAVKEGKVKFRDNLNIIESLNKIRLLSNGKIDLESVDGFVRSAALVAEYVHNRQELKSFASLFEIQCRYFDFIYKNFEPYYEIAKARGMTPHQAAIAATQSETSIAELTASISDFLEVIVEFWNVYGDIALAHAEDLTVDVKGVFGGDLFPTNSGNIASKCGIYTDTIIVPDPFLRSKHVFKHASKKDQAYFLIKHAMNLLKYKELACAQIDKPIIVVVPDYSALDEQEKDFYTELGRRDALIHANRLFGREFYSFDDLFEYASNLDTVDKLISSIVDPSRILFDSNWGKNPKDQINRALSESEYKILPFKNPGQLIATMALGRMGTSNELLFKSKRLGGSPIIEAETSWQYFLWKQEYDANSVKKNSDSKDLHVLNALQTLGKTEFTWLGNIPVEALIELRKQEALPEIRHILGKGISDLLQTNSVNFHRTSDQVFDNINKAISEQQKKLDELRSKNWLFAGTDIGSWFVTGTLAISAAVTSNPFLGVAAFAADQILDPPKLKNIPNKIKELVEENKRINQSPVGFLYKLAQS